MAMARRTGASDRGVSSEVVASCPLAVKLPVLVEFLTAAVWPDGQARETGTVLMCWEEGRWKMWLSDKDAGLQCWVSGRTLSELIASAESAIEGTGGDWRVAREKRGGPKRRS